MQKSQLICTGTSAIISIVIVAASFLIMRNYVRSEAERALREREALFVSNYRERVVRMRSDMGLPPKPIDTIEDIFEPLLSLSQ